MADKQIDARARAQEFMDALAARDWPRLSSTMAQDIRRIGVEGSDIDGAVGREPYMQWLRGFADPLFQYGWTVHRIICSSDDRTAVIDATTEYLLTASSEPFGYRLVMILDFNEQGLVARNDLYWKTPQKRVPGDTVSGKRA